MQSALGDSVPQGERAVLDLVNRGLLNADAPLTMPLHPSQVYSSIDGFLLATILWNLFPLRTRDGQLLGRLHGVCVYPVHAGVPAE